MEVEVNWWAVVLATLSSMVIGWIWYSKSVFGKSWMKLVRKTDKDLEKAGWWPMVIALIASLVTAYILAHVTFLSHAFFNYSFMQSALTTAFWLWLGLTAARMLVHDSFEGRPAKLTLMAVGYELVVLVVMALIIGWMQP